MNQTHRDKESHLTSTSGRTKGKIRREKNREETVSREFLRARFSSMFQSKSVHRASGCMCIHMRALVSRHWDLTYFAKHTVRRHRRALPEQKHRPRCTDRHTGCIAERKRGRLRRGWPLRGTMHQFSVHPWYIGRGFRAHRPKYPLRGWRRFRRRRGRISRNAVIINPTDIINCRCLFRVLCISPRWARGR